MHLYAVLVVDVTRSVDESHEFSVGEGADLWDQRLGEVDLLFDAFVQRFLLFCQFFTQCIDLHKVAFFYVANRACLAQLAGELGVTLEVEFLGDVGTDVVGEEILRSWVSVPINIHHMAPNNQIFLVETLTCVLDCLDVLKFHKNNLSTKLLLI